MDERDAGCAACVIDREARLEGVGAIDDDVGAPHQLAGRRGVEPDGPRDDFDAASEFREALCRHLDLEIADVRGSKEDLPGEIRRLDAIVVDEHQPQGKGRGGRFFAEPERSGATEPAHSEDDRGPGHAAPSRLNSRSPVVTRASPPCSAARKPAMADAWEARTPASRARLARA